VSIGLNNQVALALGNCVVILFCGTVPYKLDGICRLSRISNASGCSSSYALTVYKSLNCYGIVSKRCSVISLLCSCTGYGKRSLVNYEGSPICSYRKECGSILIGRILNAKDFRCIGVGSGIFSGYLDAVCLHNDAIGLADTILIGNGKIIIDVAGEAGDDAIEESVVGLKVQVRTCGQSAMFLILAVVGCLTVGSVQGNLILQSCIICWIYNKLATNSGNVIVVRHLVIGIGCRSYGISALSYQGLASAYGPCCNTLAVYGVDLAGCYVHGDTVCGQRCAVISLLFIGTGKCNICRLDG